MKKSRDPFETRVKNSFIGDLGSLFQCQICGHTTKTRNGLITHLEENHQHEINESVHAQY